MTYRNVMFPVWMGAGKPTSVPDGARALREALNGDALSLEVPDTAKLEATRGVKARDELLAAFREAQNALSSFERVALLGGDCSSDFALLAQSNARFAPDLAVIWLDTHADLNTPQSSPSAHFHGQVLRALLGDTDADFLELLPRPLQARQIFFGGVRDFDPPELELVQDNDIPVFAPNALRDDPGAIARAARAAGFTRTHVHLDLDVLDAQNFTSTGFPSEGGLFNRELEAVVAAIRDQLEVVSFAVTEYAPRDPADLETVMGLIRALRGEA